MKAPTKRRAKTIGEMAREAEAERSTKRKPATGRPACPGDPDGVHLYRQKEEKCVYCGLPFQDDRKRVPAPKTPAEIQIAELDRRRVTRKAKPKSGDPKPFVRETIAASAKHYCWFCFEADRELLVARVTGVQFCRQCAGELAELAAPASKPESDDAVRVSP